MTWKQVRFKDLGTWYGGGTPSKSNPAFWESGHVPWLSPKDMGAEVLVDTKDHVTEAAVVGSSTKLVPAGSVAVVTRSGILERTIPVALVPFATTMNQDMKAVVPREGIDARWIAWGLRAFERDLMRTTRKSGTTVASIEMPRWYEFELPVPPLEEQRRIVAILEDHLSRLDAGDDYARNVFRRARALVVSSLGESVRVASEEALMSTLGAHADRVEYGTSAKCHEVREEGDVPVLRMGNIRENRIDWTRLKFLRGNHPDLDRLMVSRGDLVFNRTNSAELVGKSAVVEDDRPASFASYLIRVRLAETVLPTWANMAINSPQGRAYVASCVSQQVGQANVNGTKLKAFPLPVPPMPRQHELVARHSEIVDLSDRMKYEAELVLARSAVLRRSLLAAAFSSRLGEVGSRV
ncbi:restriction endonuclease subunit S [Glutamicibacter sp.]|uniref:restriction endonuclease subunit S n=1 Tax=Glutamicibacter sp. TaxID=1931995 RepID=UPI003D6B6AB5